MHTLIPHHENNQHNTPAPRDRRTVQPSSQKKHNYHSSNSSIPRNHKLVTTPRKKTHHYSPSPALETHHHDNPRFSHTPKNTKYAKI